MGVDFEITPVRIGERPPLRVGFTYQGDEMIGSMLIEECTTRPSERYSSDDLVFTTKSDNEFVLYYDDGNSHGIIESEEPDIPEMAFPSDCADALKRHLLSLCEKE